MGTPWPLFAAFDFAPPTGGHKIRLVTLMDAYLAPTHVHARNPIPYGLDPTGLEGHTGGTYLQVRQPSLDRAVLYSGREGERVVCRSPGVPSPDDLPVAVVMTGEPR